MDNNNKMSAGWAGVSLLLLTVGIVYVGLRVPAGFSFLLVIVLIFGFMLVLGKHITGRPLGILINEQNVMSLSRFQTVLWTIIILSGFLVIALKRLNDNAIEYPLDINVDWQLWALLGISTTSLVGSPLILSTKKRKEPANEDKLAEEIADDFANEKETKELVKKNRQGILYGQESISQAKFSDMFQGDELKNTSHIDLAKVQMFFFTMIAAIVYTVALYKLISGTSPVLIESFPELSEGLIAILGISHAGYLGGKAVDHTKVK